MRKADNTGTAGSLGNALLAAAKDVGGQLWKLRNSPRVVWRCFGGMINSYRIPSNVTGLGPRVLLTCVHVLRLSRLLLGLSRFALRRDGMAGQQEHARPHAGQALAPASRRLRARGPAKHIERSYANRQRSYTLVQGLHGGGRQPPSGRQSQDEKMASTVEGRCLLCRNGMHVCMQSL